MRLVHTRRKKRRKLTEKEARSGSRRYGDSARKKKEREKIGGGREDGVRLVQRKGGMENDRLRPRDEGEQRKSGW